MNISQILFYLSATQAMFKYLASQLEKQFTKSVVRLTC